MASDHFLQEAFVHEVELQHHEGRSEVPQKSNLSEEHIFPEEEFPALPDEDDDDQLKETDDGKEDDKEDENGTWELESYQETLDERAPSSTYVSTWGYGEYYTRRAYSQDTRSSYRDSPVSRGDVMDFQRGTRGVQSRVGAQMPARDVDTKPGNLKETTILEDHNATTDGLMDTSTFESDHDGISVQMRDISVSTDLSTYDYGLNWKRGPRNPDVLHNNLSLTHPQHNPDPQNIQEVDSKDDEETRPEEIISTSLAASQAISEGIDPGPQDHNHETSDNMQLLDAEGAATPPGNHSAVPDADQWVDRSPSRDDLDENESPSVGGNYISKAPVDFSYFRSSWRDERPWGW